MSRAEVLPRCKADAKTGPALRRLKSDIRVASKQELKDRIMAAMDYFNQEPVVHTWSFKLDKAA
jgi:hypothetical protein